MINRRSLITGLISLVAAPAIVRAGSLMPVRQMLSMPIMSLMAGDVVGFYVEIGADGPTLFRKNGSEWIEAVVSPDGLWRPT